MTEVKHTLEIIDREGLEKLATKGKSDPSQVRTLKCRTTTKERFRHENKIRDLEVHIIDEPPGLLGDDTAPNPSEAALAALGSCIAVGIQANIVHRKIPLHAITVDLEADINITSVWGIGDTQPKNVGFTAVRVVADIQADAPREELEELLQHVLKWSPVTGTYVNPVPVAARLV